MCRRDSLVTSGAGGPAPTFKKCRVTASAAVGCGAGGGTIYVCLSRATVGRRLAGGARSRRGGVQALESKPAGAPSQQKYPPHKKSAPRICWIYVLLQILQQHSRLRTRILPLFWTAPRFVLAAHGRRARSPSAGSPTNYPGVRQRPDPQGGRVRARVLPRRVRPHGGGAPPLVTLTVREAVNRARRPAPLPNLKTGLRGVRRRAGA